MLVLSQIRCAVNTWTKRIQAHATICYLRQGGYVIVVVCLFVCLSVCVSVCQLATLRKDFRMDLHEIFREGWQWANEQIVKFWWRSGSGIRIRIATLIRRALAEVCTVPVLLVMVAQ